MIILFIICINSFILTEELQYGVKIRNIKAGSAVLLHSACVHEGYPITKKDTVRIVITDRLNPLKKIPYLKNENAQIKIPYTGVDYNKITD